MYNLDKFKQAIPTRSVPFAEALINSTASIPSTLITPFIMCALIERESGSGVYLTPPGPGGTGDSGHGHGIVQIDDRSYGDWLSSNDWTDPNVILPFAAGILNQNLAYFSRQAGSVITLGPIGAGKRGVSPGTYTDPRPINDQNLLQLAMLSAYNTGLGNVIASLACGANPDITTTGGNYGQDILNRAAKFKASYET